MNTSRIKFGLMTLFIFVLFFHGTSAFGASVLSLDTMEELRGDGWDQCYVRQYCWQPFCQRVTSSTWILCDDELEPFQCATSNNDEDTCHTGLVDCACYNRDIYDNSSCSGDPIPLENGDCVALGIAGKYGTKCWFDN